MKKLVYKKIYSLSSCQPQIRKHKAIAPVIGTLFLVAISAVGGSSVFVFSQDSFNNSQISGTPTIESIEITGYDARDVDKLKLHNGEEILSKNCCGVADGKKEYDERVAIYVKNGSANPVVISEFRLAGEVYSFTPSSKIGEWNKIGLGHKPLPGEYIIVNRHLNGKTYQIVEEQYPVIQSGEEATILLDLNSTKPNFHDNQVKITTLNENVFVSNLVMGQSK